MFALTPFRNILPGSQRRSSLMDIDDIFNRLLWAPDFPTTKSFGNFDMYEKDGKLHVLAEAPGINPDDVEIRVSKERVQLKSKQKEEAEKTEDDGKTWYSKKTTATFNYDLSLPFEIDTDKADASFENGLISISAPRLQVSESRVLSIKKS